jgi:hypothetical protein
MLFLRGGRSYKRRLRPLLVELLTFCFVNGLFKRGESPSFFPPSFNPKGRGGKGGQVTAIRRGKRLLRYAQNDRKSERRGALALLKNNTPLQTPISYEALKTFV